MKFSKLRIQTGCKFQNVTMTLGQLKKSWERFLNQDRFFFFPLFFAGLFFDRFRLIQKRAQRNSLTYPMFNIKLSGCNCYWQTNTLFCLVNHTIYPINYKPNLEQVCCFCRVLNTSLMLLVAWSLSLLAAFSIFPHCEMYLLFPWAGNPLSLVH